MAPASPIVARSAYAHSAKNADIIVAPTNCAPSWPSAQRARARWTASMADIPAESRQSPTCMARFNAAAGGVTVVALAATVCAPSLLLAAAMLEPPVGSRHIVRHLYASRQKRSTAEPVRETAGRHRFRSVPRWPLHQERTSVRMARSATDSSAKSHVPVASIAARVVCTCASPSDFCASQRSASSISLALP